MSHLSDRVCKEHGIIDCARCRHADRTKRANQLVNIDRAISNSPPECPDLAQEPPHPDQENFSKMVQTFIKEPHPIDNIRHPPHYTSHPSGIECIEITRHMSFNIGNAVKYLWRFDKKNGLEDLEKAIWYINDEIERMKNAKT